MPIDENWFENERLHRAAADGDMEEMRRLLAGGYGLDVFDDLGRTPLHHAVEGEHYRAAEFLIQQGAKVNANEEATIGETPLALAVQRDYPEMVDLLLSNGADPDIPGWMANGSAACRPPPGRRRNQDRDPHPAAPPTLINMPFRGTFLAQASRENRENAGIPGKKKPAQRPVFHR